MTPEQSSSSIVGVVVGAVLLFAAMSFVPLAILMYHRRTHPLRRDSELRDLTTDGTMRQVSVERWLEEQTRADNEHWEYAQESCPICLSGLLAPSQDTLPYPEPACIAPSPPDEATPESMERGRAGGGRNILVLNRCHHAFHASCLASWFEYHQYRCPTCQTSYSPRR
ncbi:hypothetical protein BO70DRAFT_364834 [Aspergillus heteromorphus CBS 117.55]|uniref:RING-type domain-containing protein n=1 Tax=Aspergillus heteromorphus CBS 117.55 TaxID=1448321 RepID=A0A317VDE1_9EURO|nr:uncharacterized protein BO70DRAFT_364834 [Aspergillus heteromorphus CBS 117.55]PWY72296.1 hypothetical protein BO70DRAFT_364834 [Aspergillus heteromorphus CBS 117.55]